MVGDALEVAGHQAEGQPLVGRTLVSGRGVQQHALEPVHVLVGPVEVVDGQGVLRAPCIHAPTEHRRRALRQLAQLVGEPVGQQPRVADAQRLADVPQEHSGAVDVDAHP